MTKIICSKIHISLKTSIQMNSKFLSIFNSFSEIGILYLNFSWFDIVLNYYQILQYYFGVIFKNFKSA